jgi:Domain of unknown function (DUF4349)
MYVRVYRSSLLVGCAALTLLSPLHGWAQPAKEPKAPPPDAPGRSLTVAATDVTPLEVPADQLLEVTGAIALRVEALDASIAELESLLPSLGGRLRDRHDASLSFEVPRDRFSEAMDRVASLGVELDRSVEVQDRTPAYLEVLALLRSAETTRNRIGGLHKGVTGVKDPLRVEGALNQWDARVAELKRKLQQIRRTTSFAVVRVQMHPTVGVVTEELSPFRLPFPWLDDIGPDRLMDFEKRDSDEYEEDDNGLESDAQMDFHLKVFRATDEVLLGGNETAMSAGMTMRGVGDTTPIGFAAGMDLELGAGFSGGFLYDYRMLAGFGTGISDFLALGVVSGFGLGGLTGDHIPFGLDIPVEAFAAVELGEIMRASTWARTSWVLASDDRQDGSDTAPFGDEFATGLSLLFGEQHGSYDHERTGLVLNGAYRELMGTHVYEVSLGFGISFLELDR